MTYGGFVLNNLFFAVFDEIITVKKSRRIRVLRDFLILSGERKLTPQQIQQRKRCWFTRLWDWFSWGLFT